MGPSSGGCLLYGRGLLAAAASDSEGSCGPCLAIGERDWEKPFLRNEPSTHCPLVDRSGSSACRA